MESSLDTRLHSTKVLISSSSVSSEEDDEDEPYNPMLLEKKTGLPGSEPGCYEEQLTMMMVEKGRTSAVRPGSSAQSHPYFLTLFLSPTTSPSSSCHHNPYHHSPPLKYHHHHHQRNCDCQLSKTCIPNNRSSTNHNHHGIPRFRFHETPQTRQMMSSF